MSGNFDSLLRQASADAHALLGRKLHQPCTLTIRASPIASDDAAWAALCEGEAARGDGWIECASAVLAVRRGEPVPRRHGRPLSGEMVLGSDSSLQLRTAAQGWTLTVYEDQLLGSTGILSSGYGSGTTPPASHLMQRRQVLGTNNSVLDYRVYWTFDARGALRLQAARFCGFDLEQGA